MNTGIHATTRSQQRGIQPLVVRCLLDFGERVYDHHGGVIIHFNKRSWRALETEWGRESIRRLFADHRNAYMVIDANDGTVITLGKRYKRIRH